MKKYIEAEAMKKRIASTPYLQRWPNIIKLICAQIDDVPEANLSERERELIRERDDMTQMYHLAQDKVQNLARELRVYEKAARTMIATKSQEVLSFSQVDFTGLEMPVIVVYFHPDDDPEMCVARIFDMDKPTNVIMRAESIWTLEQDIRHATPLVKLERTKGDDPNIVSIWM